MAAAQLCKINFIFYISPFLMLPFIVVSVTFPSPSVLRGGMVYSEEASRGPVYLNQDFMTFVRTVDPDILQNSSQLTKDFTTLYHNYCQNIADQMSAFHRQQKQTDINSVNTEWESVFSPFKHHVSEAPAVCKSMNARLPEIRDKESYDRIRTDAIRQGVHKIAAGVFYDTPHKHFRYYSDQTNARTNSPFKHMTYGGTWKGRGIEADWDSDYYISQMASSYAVIYNNPMGDFNIRLADVDDIWYWDTIMCEKKVNTSMEFISIENNMLTQLAHHNCQRDRRAIVASTQYLLAEIESITNLNITLLDRQPTTADFFPQWSTSETDPRPSRSTTAEAQGDWQHDQDQIANFLAEDELLYNSSTSFLQQTSHVQRRSPIGPVAVGIAAGISGLTLANTISSAVTGEAPLSWTGKLLGGLFGFPTAQPFNYAAMAKMANSLESLKLNQDEIVSTVNTMEKRLAQYGNLIRGTFESTAMITIEQDLKMIIRHLQVIQQLTLAKYANVFVAASLHQTSPYALSTKELQEMAKDVKRTRQLQLTQDIRLVHTTVAIIDNQINIIFEVPVMEEKNLFNFYTVTPLPVFANNKTFIPMIDTQYIAISKSGSEYITLSSDQFTRCVTDTAACQISSPVYPISTKSNCVISTYTTQILTCPLLEIKHKPEPVIHISGNRTIFSVPQETTLYVKCSEKAQSSVYEDTSITINGMGEAVFRQSCTVTLPDGTRFQTPSAPHITKLSGLNMFELLRIHPIPTDVVIHRLPEFTPIKPLSLEEVQLPSPAQLTLQAFHPHHSFPFLVQASVLIGFFLVILLILYCCRRKVKSMLHTCSCGNCFKADYEEVQRQKRTQDADDLLHKITEEFDLMKKNAVDNMAKWKSTSQTYLNTFGKSKSTNDVTLELENSLLPSPPPSPNNRIPTVKLVYKPVTPILKRVQFDDLPPPPPHAH